MTPEKTVEVLAKIEGVSGAVVKRDRRNRFKSISITYAPTGVLIGNFKVSISPVFENDRLAEVSLSGSGCAKAEIERLKTVRDSLGSKYAKSGRERVVDEDGVEIEQRVAFWNDETRVRLSWQVDAPNDAYVASSGRGVDGALAGLANLMAQSARDAAIRRCPEDAGVGIQTVVNYSSQAAFLEQHAVETQKREEKRKATRDAL
ncbi:hypothetical protein [Sphingomonas yantingensis]|uniref:Uncharacterized protein n=1 Tax=Sphingomonas yantingensis TaxID=1241761 RepID=A0A7W9EGP7_9SPHN|nr:hypothetical protein [Sphingomonas yantingensis]MBB5697154.1 hypothetical protein [Sphingomonas yantingensis]